MSEKQRKAEVRSERNSLAEKGKTDHLEVFQEGSGVKIVVCTVFRERERE